LTASSDYTTNTHTLPLTTLITKNHSEPGSIGGNRATPSRI